MEINDGYYPNTDGTCFFSALANLLLIFGDRGTAAEVMAKYAAHHFQNGDSGVLMPLATILVRELTHGKYRGKLHLRDFPSKPRVRFSSLEGTMEMASTVLEQLDREVLKGRIARWDPPDYDAHPSILQIKIRKDDGSVPHHAIVRVNATEYIDNGCRYIRQHTHGGLDAEAMLTLSENEWWL